MKRRHEEEFMAFAAARTAPLFRSACVLTSGDAHLAEDLVQDTLGRMYANWRKIAQVDDPTDKPGVSEQWRLAVKRGRDGKGS